MAQVFAQFNGLDVQVLAQMTRTPGVVPDVGVLTWRAGDVQPDSLVGDLVFFIDRRDNTPPVEVVRFTNCRLDDPNEKRSKFIDNQWRVLDRRWKWEYPVLFGNYNIRDSFTTTYTIVPATQKSPREMAALALDALGETNYNVLDLPNDPLVADEVHWHYEPAAAMLQNLAEAYGCEVHLLFDDTVKIQRKGEGDIPADTLPDGTRLAREPEVGVVLNPAPDNITCYAAETLYENYLWLEPVAEDIDGVDKPIDKMAYTPVGGWKGHDPDFGADFLGMVELNADTNLSRELREQYRDLYRRDLYKRYRVAGFVTTLWKDPDEITAGLGAETTATSIGRTQTSPPGFPVVNNNSVVTEWTLVVVRRGGETHVIDTYANRTAAVAAFNANQAAMDPEWISLYIVPPGTQLGGQFPMVTHVARWTVFDERSGGGYYRKNTYSSWRTAATARQLNELLGPKLEWTQGGLSATIAAADWRWLTPLDDKRLETSGSATQQGMQARRDPYVIGKFRVMDVNVLPRYGHQVNTQPAEFRRFRGDFSIDTERGIVTFATPMYDVINIGDVDSDGFDEYEVVPAFLLLRTAHRYRADPYGNHWHRNYTVATGNSFGTANGTVPRLDISEQNIATYADEFTNPGYPDTTDIAVSSNVRAVDEILLGTLGEEAKKYQGLQAPQKRVYTPISEVNTNGKVSQVQYTCGVGQLGQMIVSVGLQHDRTQPTALQKFERMNQKFYNEQRFRRF